MAEKRTLTEPLYELSFHEFWDLARHTRSARSLLSRTLPRCRACDTPLPTLPAYHYSALERQPNGCAVTATKLTQAQAARAAGVTRTSIWRAVRKGKLSAERMDDGSLRIDASELLRVYPQADLTRVANGGDRGTGARSSDERTVPGNSVTHGEVRVLREYIDELKRDKERLEREVAANAEERARLLSVVERQSEQVRLLTDQRERTERRPWWQRWRRAE